MEIVTVRQLRNQGADVLSRVVGGETLVVTRDGTEVAELRPLPRRPLLTSDLIARRRSLPSVDVGAMRHDIDLLMNADL